MVSIEAIDTDGREMMMDGKREREGGIHVAWADVFGRMTKEEESKEKGLQYPKLPVIIIFS